MLREPERIAFSGDWHMNTNWATRAINVCADYDVDTIVHTGDYGFTYTRSFVNDVEKACKNSAIMLYFVDGNHDNHDLLRALPLDNNGFGILSDHVRFIPRGHRWQWWDLTWLGLGGAHSVDRPYRTPMVDWWPTEWITRQEHRKAVYADKADLIGGPLAEPVPVDVMIAHDCPSGVDIPGISRVNGLNYFTAAELDDADMHRALLRETVDSVEPKLFVHGHYHVAYDAFRDGTRYVGLSEDSTTMQGNLWIVYDPESLFEGVQ